MKVSKAGNLVAAIILFSVLTDTALSAEAGSKVCMLSTDSFPSLLRNSQKSYDFKNGLLDEKQKEDDYHYLLKTFQADPYNFSSSYDELKQYMNSLDRFDLVEPRFVSRGDLNSKLDRLFCSIRLAMILQQFSLAKTYSEGIGNTTGWSEPSFKNMGKAWTKSPVFDKDDFVTNYLAHPFSGSVYYLIMRNNDFGMLSSFLFSTCLSVVCWEGFWEALFERPSIQDYLTTSPIGCFVLGEPSYKLKRYLEKSINVRPALWKRPVIFILDPVDYLTEYLEIFYYNKRRY